MNSFANDFQIKIEHWLQRDWARQQDRWMRGERIPTTDVVGSFLSEFIHNSTTANLPDYMRVLGRWPFLSLSKAIAAATQQYINCDTDTQQASNLATLMHAGVELGCAEYLFNALLDEVRQRETFGTALVRNQHVEFSLAEIQATLLAAIAYWELAVENIDHQQNEHYFNHLHKELLETIADTYLQFSGGRGYMKGHPAEIAFREVFMHG